MGEQAAFSAPGAISCTGVIVNTVPPGTSASITSDSSGNAYVNGVAIGPAPVIVASKTTSSISSTQTNLINYTPPLAVGTYMLTASISTTSGTNSGNTTCTITHTSAAGISITHLPPFEQTGSATLLTASTGASASFSLFPYVFTTDNSGTAITATFTVSGTVAEYISVVLWKIA